MTSQACPRHPGAHVHAGHCAACLLEGALAAPDIISSGIELPLGESRSASVFVVESGRRLLRLKRWRTMAPVDFAARFQDLKERLDAWRPGLVVMPVSASVDAAGCPTVLSEFQQGLPLLECVSARRLEPRRASLLLRDLLDVTTAGHDRGLAHGSIVPGNVLVGPDGSPYLLDYGLAGILSPALAFGEWVARDIDGFERLRAAL